jgi:predicted component of type VI protein secretion system
MAKETTYSGVLGRLSRFDAALEANAADLAHLEGTRTRLRTLLGGAQETAKEQAALIASKQESSKRLRSQVSEVQRVASGLRKLVIQHYGLRSEKLAEFGLQPFRGRIRKVTTADSAAPQPTTEPGSSPPDSTPTAPINPNP